MNMKAVSTICVISSIIMLFGIFYAKLENNYLQNKNLISEKQIHLMDQHIQDLQSTNAELLISGDPSRKVNLSTLEYAAFTRGYNEATNQAKSSGNVYGYAAGYHAAIEQMEGNSQFKNAIAETPVTENPVGKETSTNSKGIK